MGVNVEHVSALCGIISGTARHWSAGRSLTRLLDCTERGLAVKATQCCPVPDCPDPSMQGSWGPIPGYEGIYEINSHGDVRHIAPCRLGPVGHVLSQGVAKDGYRRVKLWRANRAKTFLVHVLVAAVFIGPAPTPVHEVNHKDGVKTNACVANLEWVTRSENNTHAWRTGLRAAGDVACGERVWCAKLTEDQVREIRRLYRPHAYGAPRLGREFGVDTTTIRSIVTGKTWKHVNSLDHDGARRPGAVAALPAGSDGVWEAETVDDDVDPEAEF